MTPALPTSIGFQWKDNSLYCENIALSTIASCFGTPCYVYSRKAIEEAFFAYEKSLANQPHLVCYALKANSNLAIIDILARLGAGFDIVSGGELARVKAAGADTSKVVFSGIGKKNEEIQSAIDANIKCFNIESIPELDRIAFVARNCGKKARVSVRVNPNVDAKTHPYISTGLKQNKFGVAYTETLSLYRKASQMPEIELVGIDCHIGSQITETAPFIDACEKLVDLIATLANENIILKHIDFGGGLGIRYRDETPPCANLLVSSLQEVLIRRGFGHLEILFEAGRSIVGNAGALLTTVEFLKTGETKNFCIVDAAMNDMLRPTLYQAWMDIIPVQLREDKKTRWDVVGPICETGDWLGKDRELCVMPGDILALMSAGAYGMSMSSNYNTRVRPAEIMVDGEHIYEIRPRESIESLFSTETRLP